MNTVDALNVLGKALCGDSFEVKPGLTDAETILEIAKNYEGGSGGGGGAKIIELTLSEQGGVYEGTIDSGLEPEYIRILTSICCRLIAAMGVICTT